MRVRRLPAGRLVPALSRSSPATRLDLSLIAGVALALLAPLVSAQDASSTDASRLQPVVVTATRIETPIEQIGSSVTVITAADIRRRGYRSLPDALADVPGMHVVQAGGPGQQTSVFTRGTNSNQTLILIDGVEVADPSTPSNTFEYAHLQLEDVQRIEVVRGPMSTLYGSDAIGGVINVITKRGAGTPSAHLRLEGGSFGTFDQAANVSGAVGGFDYRADAIHARSAGTDVTPARLRAGAPAEADGYDNKTLSTRLGYRLSDRFRAALMARYVDTNTGVDLGSGEDPFGHLLSWQRFVRGEVHARFLDGMLESTAALSQTADDRKTLDDRLTPLGNYQRVHFEGDKVKAEIKNDLYLDRHVLTLGLETEREHMHSRGPSDFGGFILNEHTDAAARTSAAYLQDQLALGRRFHATAGVRLDHHDTFGSQLTWRFAPTYELRGWGTRLRASVGTGFRAPALAELFGYTPTNFGTAFRGNPNLRPEKSFGWEVGLDQTLADRRIGGGITYFHNDVKNLISTVFDPFFNSTTVNLARAETEGFETYLFAKPAAGLDLRADYTYTRAVDASTGSELLRRPRHELDLAAAYHPTSGLDLSLRVHFTGARADVDRVTGATVQDGGYAVVDLSASWHASKRVTLFGRVDNLLDRHYEPANGFQAAGIGVFAGTRLAL